MPHSIALILKTFLLGLFFFWNFTHAASGRSLEEIQTEQQRALDRVTAIVNQPVQAFSFSPSARAKIFGPGWFHPGAIKPDFNHVDIRKTQETAVYDAAEYVTSDITPGAMFPGSQVEFNAMTKYFYTDRSLPKKRLTEAEMLEINGLYRVIGRCESELAALQNPPSSPMEIPPCSSSQASASIWWYARS